MPTFIFNTPAGRKSVKVPRWAMILAGIVAAGLGVLLLLLAASLALVIVPLAFLVVGIASWQARRKFRKHGRTTGTARQQGAPQREPRSSGQPDVIEGDYKVIVHKSDPK
jgi:predicted lipid-binding transport protein (Tim44 family)